MNKIDEIIDKYYNDNLKLKDILLTHSRLVANKAICICKSNNLDVKLDFIYEAAMLHDIGIFMCDAPGINCYGKAHYIHHGYLGADLLRKEGLEKHALVAERHTGTGLGENLIKQFNLPEGRIYSPQSLEETVICYADKFYSKTRLTEEKSPEAIIKTLSKWGEESANKFKMWHKQFNC